jgi:hypothetical protein
MGERLRSTRVFVDPLLNMARAKGTISTWHYNPETNEVEASSVRVDVTWQGQGNLSPYVGHSEYLATDPDQQSGYATFGFDLGAGRKAIAKGSLDSSKGSDVEGSSPNEGIYEGSNVFVSTFA